MYLWSLQVSLGQYPEEHFSEDTPCKFIKDFQAELQRLSAEIKTRNADLEIPFTYMDPGDIENSVAIWTFWILGPEFRFVVTREQQKKWSV